MITLEGEHWRRLRKMFNPAFSQGHLDKLVPGIVEETLIFVQILEEAAKRDEDFLMLDALTVSLRTKYLTRNSYSRWTLLDGRCKLNDKLIL
jgi:cytochrome P450